MTETTYDELAVWDDDTDEPILLLGEHAQALADEFAEVTVDVTLTLEDVANIADHLVEQMNIMPVGSPEHTRLNLILDALKDVVEPVARPIVQKHIAAHRARISAPE